ncbi:PREDICTED: uncharacterized protein LOC106745924 isoform X2 [Dinoponera quadriceps]|uniref:Uncharacterized protein LOC106745924 isoform X2 n=1 Tax=Dinoponera quadriceps TaxID=609295 RepID=A0A6P3XHJ5_DINQU|nr:PREDICTED: uncharacterized protein LOC106745924 isoform X2 [Dinoponera quadriceps]
MGVTKLVTLLLLASVASRAWSHHHHGYYPEHRKENGRVDFVERASTADETSEKSTDRSTRSELSEKDEKRPDALDSKDSPPFNARRLEKMLEKAILKIITGDLSTADMLLLKSLNYTFEEILAIREQEFSRRKDEEKAKKFYNSMLIEQSNDPDGEVSRSERKKNRYKEKLSFDDFDFDAYNQEATIDYENLATKLEQQSWPEPAALDYEDELKSSKEQDQSRNVHRSFDRAMEPHVIFKIRYDDSEFDSGSNERPRLRDAFTSKDLKHRTPSALRHTTTKNVANSFHASSLSSSSSSSSSPSSSTAEHTPLPVVYQMRNLRDVKSDYLKNQHSVAMTASSASNDTVVTNAASNATTSDATTDSVDDDDSSAKKIGQYEGLEWVEDDVYKVIPSLAGSLTYEDSDENGTSDYEESNLAYLSDENENDTLEYRNDTLEYQNDTPVRLFNVNASMEKVPLTNQSTRHQLAAAHRQNESQKIIEEIKMRVLMFTGKLNNTTSKIDREKLTMFSPTCQLPRNTDFEAWTDPFLMNMHFQLNLTAGDVVAEAKLRIYKLPQEDLVTSVSGDFNEGEVREKKIRISVFYYMKSLKTYRSKRWLMDSVLTPLTANGGYLVLDVKEALKFWRLPSRNSHGNGSNHGLGIQIEEQADEKKLKPALYIQQPSCGDHDSDQKPSAYPPSSFEPVLITFVS